MAALAGCAAKTAEAAEAAAQERPPDTAGLSSISSRSESISSRKREGGLRWVRPKIIRLWLEERYSSFLARVMPT